MEDSNENRLVHLQLIQGAIDRLAGNSNLLKGWSVTAAATLFTLAVLSEEGELAIVALFTTLLFWGLDSYYLRQERLFRNLYKAVHGAEAGRLDKPLSMDTRPYATSRDDSFVRVLLRPPMSIFHGAILLGVIVISVVLNP